MEGIGMGVGRARYRTFDVLCQRGMMLAVCERQDCYLINYWVSLR